MFVYAGQGGSGGGVVGEVKRVDERLTCLRRVRQGQGVRRKSVFYFP